MFARRWVKVWGREVQQLDSSGAQYLVVVPVLGAKVDDGAYPMRRCQVRGILARKRTADGEPLRQPVKVRPAPRRHIFLHFFMVFFFSYNHEAPGECLLLLFRVRLLLF
jgi:hypothetical protein